MKILDVQEFRKNQFDDFRKRRTSQFIKFLDKDVDFITYYSINKAESTYSLENHDVDSYIGYDSPVKYNKINNLPVYGINQINDQNEYDDDAGGFSNNSYEGEMILLPEIIEPCENDAFILNIFDENRIFMVNEVSQIILKSKPHYVVKFHIEPPEYLDKLNKQVSAEFNAIFDNIGTEDKVIVSNADYDLCAQYKDIYAEFSDYYKHAFFKPKLSIFEIEFYACKMKTKQNVHYIDKFLQKFMQDERIIIMDKLLRDSLMLDYNNIFDSNDYKTYKESLYWAIINKDISNMNADANFIYINKISSPFSLTYAINPDWYFTSDGFITKTDTSFGVDFDFSTIINRYLQKDTSIKSDDPYTKALSIIVNYMNNNVIMPGYFYGIIGNLTKVQEYELIPILMYILRDQINRRMQKLNKII